MEAVVSAET